MKFKVTFKDPDGPCDSIAEAARESLPADLSEAEKDTLLDARIERLKETTRLFFEYGEYVCIEIDTDAKTARVVPVKEK
jgi:hypothetical protein